MSKIKNIVFDLGGIIFEIDKNRAIEHFKEVGFADAKSYLDAFTQVGIFGQLEAGQITAEEFRSELSKLAGKEMTLEDCYHGWTGYYKQMHQYILDAVLDLRARGYRVSLLSNTNPYMMQWARSNDFDGNGHPVDYYFDKLYLSYECKVMKPDARIFEMMLEGENAKPEETIFIDDSPHNVKAAAELGIHTLQPANGEDWREMLEEALNKDY
ncbi:MAG: HAD family phosphatase [Bacteroidales bacterium]|nr:HAD family phosphatase [Candidatus Sodaliphilus fimicaballi]